MVASVMFVGESRTYLDALCAAFEHTNGWRVVSRATSHEDAIAASSSTPNLIVIGLPHPDGPTVSRRLLDRLPSSRVLAISVSETEVEFYAWARAGVTACTGRHDTLDEVLRAAARAVRGEYYCSQQLAAGVLKCLAHAPNAAPGQLTTRETEIMKLMERGLSNKEIAAELYVQLPTIKNHVHSIFSKLGVRTRRELILRTNEPGEPN
jgi:two-component system, NarL family, nitrate/nitrite response regulator NarL